MITEIDYFLECTRSNCPNYCHWLIDHHNGKKEEEFTMNIISQDGYQMALTIRNISEFVGTASPVTRGRTRERIKYCLVCYEGSQLHKYEDYIMPYGLLQLPFNMAAWYNIDNMNKRYPVPKKFIYNQDIMLGREQGEIFMLPPYITEH